MNARLKKRAGVIAAQLREQLGDMQATLDALREIVDEAEDSLNNMPESLRYNSDRGQTAESEWDEATNARDSIESGLDEIDSAVSILESII